MSSSGYSQLKSNYMFFRRQRLSVKCGPQTTDLTCQLCICEADFVLIHLSGLSSGRGEVQVSGSPLSACHSRGRIEADLTWGK